MGRCKGIIVENAPRYVLSVVTDTGREVEHCHGRRGVCLREKRIMLAQAGRPVRTVLRRVAS